MVQQTINLYAWRENEKMIPPVLITQGESDTRTATFRLLDQATTIDLTGKSISFEYDKPDGFHVSLVCQPTEDVYKRQGKPINIHRNGERRSNRSSQNGINGRGIPPSAFFWREA